MLGRALKLHRLCNPQKNDPSHLYFDFPAVDTHQLNNMSGEILDVLICCCC